jgi:hypothetical protein
MKGRNLLREQEVDVKIISKFILEKEDMILWTGFICLMLGATDRLL